MISVLCAVFSIALLLVAGFVRLFLSVFDVVNAVCSIKKNNVGLQITPCCITVVQVRSLQAPPLCADDDFLWE